MKENPNTETEKSLVDIDGDGLDDRLIKKGIQENETIKDVLHRLDQIQLQTLEEKTIQSMICDIDTEQQSLLEKAQMLERDVHQQIVKGRSNTLKKMRKNIRMLNRRYEELQDEKDKLLHIIQELRLKKNIQASIGKKGSVYLERCILVLILFVLGLLLYDFSVIRPDDHILNPWNIFYIDTICCGVFLIEFFFRMFRADNKWWFWKNNWIDFVTSIPIPPADESRFVRLGRATRFLRFLRLLRVLRLFRAIYFLWRGMEKISDLFDIKMMKKSLRWAFFVIFFGALVIMKIEGEQEGIQHGVEYFSHSIWWSFTTVVTGGFGDIYNPTTFGGQLITGVLVLSGMILIGVFTANLTSLYIGEETDDLGQLSESIESKLKDMEQEMNERFKEQKIILETLQEERKKDHPPS